VSVVLDLMNFIAKHTGLSITKLFIAKKLSHAAAESFNVRAQNRRCTTCFCLFLNLTSFATYMCLMYTLYYFWTYFKRLFELQGEKTVILRVVG